LLKLFLRFNPKLMPSKITKKIPLIFATLTLLFLAYFYLYAWIEPTTAPPGGNVPAPINVGSTDQTKQGRLGIKTGIDPHYSLTIGTQGLKITNTGNQPTLYLEDKSGDTTPFIIDSAGKVGIGTTNPTERLDVEGNIAVGTTYLEKEHFIGKVLLNN
jgi:hypothetical protein